MIEIRDQTAERISHNNDDLHFGIYGFQAFRAAGSDEITIETAFFAATKAMRTLFSTYMGVFSNKSWSL